jgi:hypothetical protein
VAGCGGRRTAAVSRRGSNRSYRVVSNICEGKLILCVDLIRFFLQFFEINEVSSDEWVAQKVTFVHHPHPKRSQSNKLLNDFLIISDIYIYIYKKILGVLSHSVLLGFLRLT